MRRSYKGISINTSENTHEKVFDLLNKDKEAVIVDIPSGAGAFILRLKDNGYKNIIAFDIENLLEVDHKDFVIGDMTKRFPLENNSVDVVVCIDGIEHISKQFDFIEEVNRVLRVGGEVVISTPNISSLRSRWKWLMTGHHHKCSSPLNEDSPNFLHHIGMISFPEMRYLLHTKGFRINKVTTNRVKPISYLYLLLAPFSYIFTAVAYNKYGRKDGTKKINNEIKKVMFSKSILLGETLIVKAKKERSA